MVLGISRDVTGQKEIVDQMANTEKLASLGLLSAGIAHEINNPIAIIMGFADLLLEMSPPEDARHDMLVRIMRQAETCERIVSQLLTFSRVAETPQATTDINRDIETVTSVVANALLLKKVRLVLHLADKLPTIKADPKQIEQVFLNLINNASGAMPNGGVLTITSSFDEATSTVQAAFADTGCGIAKEHRAKVLDPFFTTKKAGEGTGLGLTVSHNIVSSYGGSLSFTTRTADEDQERAGTTFLVRFPSFVIGKLSATESKQDDNERT